MNISVAGRGPMQKYQHHSTIPYIYDWNVFVIPRGKPYSSLAKLFFPFKVDVWICLGSSLLAMVTWILIMQCIPKEKCDFVMGGKSDAPILNLLSIILCGSMTTHQMPRRIFARTVLGVLLLSTMILRNGYLGNLYNFLRTQKRMESPFTQQKIFDSDASIHVIRGDAIAARLSHLLKRLDYSTLSLDDLRDDNLDGVYVHLKNAVDYNNFQNFRKPKILMTKDYIYMYPIVIWVRQLSCLKNAFDHQISALHSSGLVDYWQRSYTKTVKDIEDNEPKKLNIDQFTGIYMVCAALYALSFFVFIVELTISKCVRKKNVMSFLKIRQ